MIETDRPLRESPLIPVTFLLIGLLPLLLMPLAAVFLFTVHFFNTHFRLEKFPMDNVIFSGRISKTEMLHERKLWYDRLVATGRLDKYRIRDEWDRVRGIARPLGFLFFGTGLLLLALIVYAMVTRLGHYVPHDFDAWLDVARRLLHQASALKQETGSHLP